MRHPPRHLVAEQPQKRVVPPSLPVGWPEKVPDGRGHLVDSGEPGSSEVSQRAEGLWIQCRPCDALGDEETMQRKFCILCESWADEEHLTSRRHLQAQRAIAGGATRYDYSQDPLHSEPDLLSFPVLHSVDLSYPEQE